ncbi:MAG TPA: Asp-tRNA(Asn)/Glu-tRNA(Gln) amidotransferase subunit GatC [Chloroflexota bacterium]|nr:Asp-tRNA(Asn)/Glu-tRNA(Gln) amidotransferase subunit GatC [Chloroflexota bacterium]
MSLTRGDVEKIAQLARLELTEDELTLYQGQLSAILDYAERLNELNLGDVPPTAHAVTQQNVWREDVAEPGMAMGDVLFNAPQQANNQFVVQAVLDEG